MQRHGRGTTEDEGREAIAEAAREQTRHGRWVSRWDFRFAAVRQGRRHAIKQVAPVVAESEDELVVTTVHTLF